MEEFPWSLEINSGEEGEYIIPAAGHRYRVTQASLVDPASTGDESVTVAIKTAKGGELVLWPMSAAKPVSKLWSAPPLDEEFWLRRKDSSHAVVRFEGFVLLPPPPPLDEAMAGMSEEEDSDWSDDETDEEEESDDEADPPLVTYTEASGGTSFVPEGEFLGPARAGAAGITAGCMQVAAVAAAGAGSQQDQRKEISVLYRYTRFSLVPSSSGEEAMQVRGSTRVHQLRFVVPSAGDPASSLPWVGSSLAHLVYPDRIRAELQELWSGLASPVRVPPSSTRLEVVVDVGVLQRRRDYTLDRMGLVLNALEGMMGNPWPAHHVGMELHLPEPKRRKIDVAGQECPVCLEALESDLAAWPGCYRPHVFHGACLVQHLKQSEMCPICRRRLSDPVP